MHKNNKKYTTILKKGVNLDSLRLVSMKLSLKHIRTTRARRFETLSLHLKRPCGIRHIISPVYQQEGCHIQRNIHLCQLISAEGPSLPVTLAIVHAQVVSAYRSRVMASLVLVFNDVQIILWAVVYCMV